MHAKYLIEYSVQRRSPVSWSHHGTDDPVAALEFLAEQLERGCRLGGICREGTPLTGVEYDRMLKGAAEMVAVRRLCHSLGISAEEARYRFGLAG